MLRYACVCVIRPCSWPCYSALLEHPPLPPALYLHLDPLRRARASRRLPCASSDAMRRTVFSPLSPPAPPPRLRRPRATFFIQLQRKPSKPAQPASHTLARHAFLSLHVRRAPTRSFESAIVATLPPLQRPWPSSRRRAPVRPCVALLVGAVFQLGDLVRAARASAGHVVALLERRPRASRGRSGAL